MRQLLLLTSFIFILSGTYGQSDPKAQTLLKSVSEKYKSLKSIKASFTITVENGKDKSKEVQKGTLFMKGSKYKLEIAGLQKAFDGA